MKLSIKTRLAILAIVSLGPLTSPPIRAESQPKNNVYVQASEGSYNHEAINKLSAHNDQPPFIIEFSGTHEDTLKKAAMYNQMAFFAVSNSTIDKNLVQGAVEALRHYRIEVLDYYVLPIDICLLKNPTTTIKNIQKVASHPAALKQISQWVTTHKLVILPEPAGTSAAAKKLMEKEYDNQTVVAGSCNLTALYPSLSIIERSIQNPSKIKNATLFVLAKINPRKVSISYEASFNELKALINQHVIVGYWEGK